MIVRRRIAILITICLLSAVALAFVVRVGFESSIEIWFLKNDPDLITYHKLLRQFGGDQYTVVAFFANDVFAPDVIKAVREMTETARHAPYADRVVSLTTLNVLDTAGGSIGLKPLVPKGDVSRLTSARLRKRAFRSRWLTKTLVSPDGRATAVLVELDPSGNTFSGKTAMVDFLRQAARKLKRPGLDVRLAGFPVTDAAFFRYSTRDMETLGPVVALVIIAILAVVLRSAVAVAVPMAVVTIAILWTHGVMGAAGIDLNVVTTMLVALILAIGVADTIHIVSDYLRQLALGRSHHDAIQEALRDLFVPCVFTSATTAVGLLSLLSSDLLPIAQFGWLAALGVAFAFLLSLAFAPALLALVPPPSAEILRRPRSGLLARLLTRLERLGPRSDRYVLITAAVLTAVALYGITLLNVGSNPMNYFRKGDPVRRDIAAVDKHFGGSVAAEFLIRAPHHGLLEPANLRRVAAFERWIASQPGFGPALSFVDALKAVNEAMHGGDPADFVVPSSRAAAAQAALLLQGQDEADAFVGADYSIGRMTARVSLTHAETTIAHMDGIEAKLRQEFRGSGLEVKSTGFVKLMAEMQRYLLRSQIESFAIAFLVITAMMGLLFGSIRIGAFAMIPNVIPIVLGLGFMGFVGIALDPGTVMIASIALGLVVDDTMHLLHRIRRHVRSGSDLEAAIRLSLREAGQPVVITSVVLAAGFSALALGSFAPNVYFGVVSAFVILLALLADLLILPALLRTVRPRL